VLSDSYGSAQVAFPGGLVLVLVLVVLVVIVVVVVMRRDKGN
jgi:hypothetical protein